MSERIISLEDEEVRAQIMAALEIVRQQFEQIRKDSEITPEMWDFRITI